VQFPSAFGKYELLERIATGGMAEVFLARSFGVAGFEKRLVIKRIRPELAQDPRFVSLFINEAKIGVQLNHPNVVQVYDLGRVGSSWYMAMEHLHGRDLTRLVKTLRANDARLPAPDAVAIMARVCRGLAYAHALTDAAGERLGLVHRDVSPHNIVVCFDGEVKVVDFGVARLMNTTEAAAAEREPGRPGGGKYAYMSPEQASGGVVDHRTDIFSAGIVLWELLVGHRLFQSDDAAEKLRRVTEAIVPHPSTEGVDIDQDLWRILQRALAREPAERYASASLFEEDLRAWLFERNLRVGRDEIALQMKAAFPAEAAHHPMELDLARMVADLDRLEAPDGTQGSATPRQQDDESLPGRLRPSDGERKMVAVLVIDIDGLTDLSARVDPETLFKRRFQLLKWIRLTTLRFGGEVTSAVDDHVVVLFGVPRTQIDDLHRALRCALDLHRNVGDLRQRGLNVVLAIGVHVGEVTVSIGPRRLRYVARGDTTRLARRLSAVADHGEVLASERVLLGAESSFLFRRGVDVANRGGRQPIPAYRLLEPRRGLRIANRGSWLRRGAELDVIRAALVGLGLGTGRVIALSGDTGTGKSRLLSEIRDRAHRRGLPFYLGRCSPFGEDPPLEPFRDLLREVLGLNEDATPAMVQAQIGSLSLLGLTDRQRDTLGSLLGLRAPVHTRDQTWVALADLIAGLGREGPVIIALEDVHLLREAERHRLAALLAASRTQPVLFLLTSLPPTPMTLEFDDVVNLEPFNRAAQELLIQSLLETTDVQPALLDYVVRTCEGNPLYLEHMVKYLQQDGTLTTRGGEAVLTRGLPEAPAGLIGLVAARIDALDAAAKGALQLAAVIGLTFHQGVLAEAAGIVDLTPLASNLANHGLIRRADTSGDSWTFSSELVRQAALRGILGVQQRDYHRLVAAAIEKLYPTELDVWAETLANHCAQAGRTIDATRYALQAATRMRREQLLEQARDLLERALKWIVTVPEAEDTWDARVQGEATLRYRHGVVCVLLGDVSAGERSLSLALDIAADADLPWIELRAHTALGKSQLEQGNLDLASAHLAQARSMLQFEDDRELEIDVLEASANLAYTQGLTAEAEDMWHDVLQLAQGDAQVEARCILGLANRHIHEGDTDVARKLLERALDAAQRAGDRILIGRVLNNIGLLHSNHGEHEEAITWFREALLVRQGIGYTRGVAINHHNIGDANFHLGRWARAYVAFEQSRDLAVDMSWAQGRLLNEVYMGAIDAMLGDDSGGLALLDRAVEEALALGAVQIATTGLWLSGQWLATHGREAEGHDRLQRALDAAKRHDLRVMTEAIEAVLAQFAEAAATSED